MLRSGLAQALAVFALGIGSVLPGGLAVRAHAEAAIEIQQRAIEAEATEATTTLAVRVTNRGAQSAEEVIVYGTAPHGHRLKAASLLPTRDGERLIWPLGILKPGEVRELRMQWEQLPELNDVPLKCHLRVAYRLQAESVIDLPPKLVATKISIVVPESATLGVPVAVRIGVTNPNNRPARDVMLVATFAPGLTHALGKEIENSLGTIEAGQMRVIPLELIPTQYGELRGKIRVQVGAGAIAEKEFILPVRPAKISLNVSAPAQCPDRASALIGFTVQNTGAEASKRVRLVVQLPPGLGFSTASDGGAYVPDGNCAYWDMGELKPNEQRLVKLVVLAQGVGDQKITAVLSAEARETQSHSSAIQILGNPTGGRP